MQPGQPGQVAADELAYLVLTADLDSAGVVDHHHSRPHRLQRVCVARHQSSEIIAHRVAKARGEITAAGVSIASPAYLPSLTERRRPRLAPGPCRRAAGHGALAPGEWHRRDHQ